MLERSGKLWETGDLFDFGPFSNYHSNQKINRGIIPEGKNE